MTTKQSESDRDGRKNVSVITHVSFENLGSFEQILREAGYVINYINASSEDLTEIRPQSDDLLIILGGPISVNDVDAYPFLLAELELLSERLSANKPTLGICLGAQLIAKALGAAVYPGSVKEIGWSSIQLSDGGSRSALRHLVGEDVCVLHWHGETFDLPDDAGLLASSQGYPHQAFDYGKTLALQFHPEVTQRGLEQWFVGHAVEIHQTAGVSVSQLRADSARYAETLQARGYRFLLEWLDDVSEQTSA